MKIELSFETLPEGVVMVVAHAFTPHPPIPSCEPRNPFTSGYCEFDVVAPEPDIVMAQGRTVVEALERLHKAVQTHVFLKLEAAKEETNSETAAIRLANNQPAPDSDEFGKQVLFEQAAKKVMNENAGLMKRLSDTP